MLNRENYEKTFEEQYRILAKDRILTEHIHKLERIIHKPKKLTFKERLFGWTN